MRFYWILVGLAYVLIFGMASINEVKKVPVSIAESTIQWEGYKVFGSHHGSLTLESGEFLMNGGQLKGGHFTVDMNSIVVEDLEGESQDRLENHLKSDDFFAVDSYPYAQFEIIRISAAGAGYFLIEGNITIKDHTEPLEFEAEIVVQNGRMEATTKIQIDRGKFDMKYRSGSFFSNLGDRMIYDNFDLTVYLVADITQ